MKIKIKLIYINNVINYHNTQYIKKETKMHHKIAMAEKKSNNNNEEWFEMWISWWGWLL